MSEWSLHGMGDDFIQSALCGLQHNDREVPTSSTTRVGGVGERQGAARRGLCHGLEVKLIAAAKKRDITHSAVVLLPSGRTNLQCFLPHHHHQSI
eukprot:gene9462-6643_t